MNRRKGTGSPLGVLCMEHEIQFSVFLPKAEQCDLILYRTGTDELLQRVTLTEHYKSNGIFSVIFTDWEEQSFDYEYQTGGSAFTDPYAVGIAGRRQWGEDEPCRCHFERLMPVTSPVKIVLHDMILYRIHVRGFTKHQTSGVKAKGTFAGVEEKIPYLKELGINAVELMPCYDFHEFDQPLFPASVEGNVNRDRKNLPEVYKKINYWGYTQKASYFAPKNSFSWSENAITEFKELVERLHEQNIAVIMEFYFSPGTPGGRILDCLRHWRLYYGVDGFRVNSNVVPLQVIATDPLLSQVILFTDGWSEETIQDTAGMADGKHLAEYNDAYLEQIRSFLRGDEERTGNLAKWFCHNPEKIGAVHYLANTNGFTLADAFTYDIKHNEENGENNKDGRERNYSWNCGVEGPSRQKKVLQLRRQMIKNAWVVLLCSQGIPLIQAGDEMGHSAGGNNNPYCQDNSVNWLNWNDVKRNDELFSFVKQLIFIRKKNMILHMEKPLDGRDTKRVGSPDVSFHGIMPWYPDYGPYSRQLGILLCGAYSGGDSLYFAFNMHWEAHTFYFPNLSGQSGNDRKQWEILLQTAAENIVMDGESFTVPPRSIVVFVKRRGEKTR
ncbi:alpha-amylase family glycosyl hydrolase [Anaerolentibacter hominis]|uniref:alpha-amylase family glycosyl hydrolase n=1 Tax=Anaerolentibacter hominis TaxID=3079009 RepID=UPI0031B7FB5F